MVRRRASLHIRPLTGVWKIGESEYWFAMIKVIMILVFIIVGLIYDWGGVRHHPGPVRSIPISFVIGCGAFRSSTPQLGSFRSKGRFHSSDLCPLRTSMNLLCTCVEEGREHARTVGDF